MTTAPPSADRLVHLYDTGAHREAGYFSFGAYVRAEFGMPEAAGYRLLEQGRAFPPEVAARVEESRRELSRDTGRWFVERLGKTA